ncbi:hypothetical protein OJAV_G00075520 [Oryzias javanicus]|uniref:DNA topoisomerase n=1 Tax=Oryzias javanicus TaxID=123683 RepID=A0A437D2W9_ORYJA|nr:hypothetical protein OJAV_G00075520 [Oryzias javanicus]
MLIVHLLSRSSFRSGLFRLIFQPRFLCAAQRSRCTDTTQETNMIRSRTQIKRVLCVAEKNDAAKGISEIMSNGRARRREGMSKFNKIYEYEYFLFGQNVTVTMTSVSGHLLAGVQSSFSEMAQL